MTDSTAEVRELVRDMVSGEAPGADRDAQLWRDVVEAGLHRVSIAEDRNGSGGDLAYLGAVVMASAEVGANLPLVEVAAAEWAIAEDRPLGESVAAVALAHDGVVRGVQWASQVSHLVVIDADRVVIGAVPVHPVSDTDLTGSPVSSFPIETLQGEPLGVGAGNVLNRWNVLETCALAGFAAGAFDLTKRYVSDREAFQKTLIQIPAVESRVGEMRVQLTLAETAIGRVLRPGASSADAAIARIVVSDAASTIAALTHQLHGAIGITREYSLHPYTTAIWARRDHVQAETDAARMLGSAAGGTEEAAWELTSVLRSDAVRNSARP